MNGTLGVVQSQIGGIITGFQGLHGILSLYWLIISKLMTLSCDHFLPINAPRYALPTRLNLGTLPLGVVIYMH